MDIETSDADSVKFAGVFRVRDGELQVVIEVKLVVLKPSERRRRLETDWVSADSVV